MNGTWTAFYIDFVLSHNNDPLIQLKLQQMNGLALLVVGTFLCLEKCCTMIIDSNPQHRHSLAPEYGSRKEQFAVRL